MNIVITGVTGFIGQQLEAFLQEAHSITGVTRREDNIKNHFKSSYSTEHLKELFYGADVVINLASQKALTNNTLGIQAYIPSVIILENILSASKECGIQNVINISSRCVYSSHTDTEFKETDVVHPLNMYGVMKLWNENLSDFYNRTYSMHIKNLRLSQVIGYPMFDKYMFSTFLEKIQKDDEIQIQGQGSGQRDYIYIKDVCKAISLAVQADKVSGVYNIASGIGTSNIKIAQKMKKVFESKSNIHVLPESPSDLTRVVLDTTKAKQDLHSSCDYTIDEALYDIKNIIKKGIN